MTRIGRYELGKLLGTGGAGEVYEAVLVGPRGLRKPVALKVLHRGEASLRREARLGGLLRHHHLVDVYEVGEVDGQWFCALELCAGGALSDYLPLPPRAVVDVGLQVCEALAYAHEQLGLVHLDIKPDNLLIHEGLVKLADLGIAQTAEVRPEDRRVRGTPIYMAPEQARGEPVDARTDLYALGVTLVELATGSRQTTSGTLDLDSFGSDSETMDLDRLVPELPTHPIPEWLAPAVGPCLAPLPADRWPDAAALHEALAALPVEGPGLSEVLGVDRDTSPDARGRLPEHADAFVGRADELDTVARALEEASWVTLRGPAGIGKTRLAVASADRWAGSTGGARALCDLSGVDSLDGVLGLVVQVLDLPRSGGPIPRRVQRAGHALAARGPLVVVLDNLEQVTDDLGPLTRWATLAPDARFLATSRAALGIPDEHVVDVPPLDLEEARALLVARALDRGVDLSTDPDVDRLAERLEGIPLALELAAGRLGVLSVAEVLDRMDLSLLRRATPGRHGTLRAALDGSWELLSPLSRDALAQLSVFEGGFTVELAEQVLELDGSVLDAIGALVEHSMVRPLAEGRFGMYRAVQDYAAEQLVERESVERRHGRALARIGARDRFHRRPRASRRARARDEVDNLVAACRRAVARSKTDPDELPIALHTLRAAWMAMVDRGPYPVAAELALEVLAAFQAYERTDPEPWGIAGQILRHAGRRDEAEAHLRTSLELAQAQGLIVLEADAQGTLGHYARRRGAYEEAARRYIRAFELFRKVRDRWAQGVVLGNLAITRRYQGDYSQARELLERGLEIHRAVGNQRAEGDTLSNLGALNWEQGRLGEARACLEEAVAVHRSSGNRQGELVATGNLAAVLTALGRHDDARQHLETVRLEAWKLGDFETCSNATGNLGNLLHDIGCYAEAEPVLHEAIALAERVGARVTRGQWERSLGNVLRDAGRFDDAERAYQTALATAAELDDRHLEGDACCERGLLEQARGGNPGQWFERAVEAYAFLDHPTGSSRALGLLARVSPDRAEDLLDRATAVLGDADAPQPRAEIHGVRALLALDRGDRQAARDYVEAARSVVSGQGARLPPLAQEAATRLDPPEPEDR